MVKPKIACQSYLLTASMVLAWTMPAVADITIISGSGDGFDTSGGTTATGFSLQSQEGLVVDSASGNIANITSFSASQFDAQGFAEIGSTVSITGQLNGAATSPFGAPVFFIGSPFSLNGILTANDKQTPVATGSVNGLNGTIFGDFPNVSTSGIARQNPTQPSASTNSEQLHEGVEQAPPFPQNSNNYDVTINQSGNPSTTPLSSYYYDVQAIEEQINRLRIDLRSLEDSRSQYTSFVESMNQEKSLFLNSLEENERELERLRSLPSDYYPQEIYEESYELVFNIWKGSTGEILQAAESIRNGLRALDDSAMRYMDGFFVSYLSSTVLGAGIGKAIGSVRPYINSAAERFLGVNRNSVRLANLGYDDAGVIIKATQFGEAVLPSEDFMRSHLGQQAIDLAGKLYGYNSENAQFAKKASIGFRDYPLLPNGYWRFATMIRVMLLDAEKIYDAVKAELDNPSESTLDFVAEEAEKMAIKRTQQRTEISIENQEMLLDYNRTQVEKFENLIEENQMILTNIDADIARLKSEIALLESSVSQSSSSGRQDPISSNLFPTPSLAQ